MWGGWLNFEFSKVGRDIRDRPLRMFAANEKKVGMSFGVRFKVRTFGNNNPDGSNVRIFRIGS